MFKTSGLKEKSMPAERKLRRRPFGAGHLNNVFLIYRRRMQKGQRCSIAVGQVVGRKPRVGIGGW